MRDPQGNEKSRSFRREIIWLVIIVFAIKIFSAIITAKKEGQPQEKDALSSSKKDTLVETLSRVCDAVRVPWDEWSALAPQPVPSADTLLRALPKNEPDCKVAKGGTLTITELRLGGTVLVMRYEPPPGATEKPPFCKKGTLIQNEVYIFLDWKSFEKTIPVTK